MRGRAHYMLGEHDMAQRHAQEGLRMDPEHSGCKDLYRLVRKLSKLDAKAADEEKHGRYEEAVRTVSHRVTRHVASRGHQQAPCGVPALSTPWLTPCQPCMVHMACVLLLRCDGVS